MSTPHKNRTIICSVVFLDMVDYSKLTVRRQHEVKTAFNRMVGENIARIPEDERFVLDTGDGAALCFIGDPEDALFVAMDLRNEFAEAEVDERPFPPVRIGINLGPVRAVTDLSGRMNLIGDGINVGQRIMSFAEPGQILVARSYFEVVGCLSTKHARLFRYLGERRDKHVREHVVYEVHLDDQDTSDPSVVATEVDLPQERALLTSEQAHVVADELARSVGPMAKVLVERALRTASSHAGLLEHLMGLIPDGPARQDFKRRFEASVGSPAQPDSHARGSEAAAPATNGAPGRAWSDAELEAAQVALARHIGPLAGLLVKRAAAESKTLAGLYQRLAAEVPAGEHRRQFLESAPRDV